MSLTNLIPWSRKRPEEGFAAPVSHLRDEMDRLFGRFFQEAWEAPWSGGALANWAPAVEMSETDKEIVVRLEIPGVDPKDFDVSLHGDVLTLAGQKKETSAHREKNYHCTECSYGAFARSLRLPAEVDGNKVDAAYRDGVLTVTLAKTAQAAAKRIAVKHE